ncbi:MAG: hypothetical protein SGI77_02945 [Pirellulaceae bacterium]|nr:hypothetical protein [Pirellulaceae bacterium]
MLTSKLARIQDSKTVIQQACSFDDFETSNIATNLAWLPVILLSGWHAAFLASL